MRCLWIVALALAAFGFPANAAPSACTVTRIVDGDTLHLDCGAGERKVRLLGFDTPEIFHPHCAAEKAGGEAARLYMAGLVAKGPVTGFAVEGRDRYGRDLAHVAIGGQDLSALMLASGLALPYAGHRHPDWCARSK